VASSQKLRYYEHVVTSRTQPRDLLWTFDNVRRLADAQVNDIADSHRYLRPGALWWAFDRDSAVRKGRDTKAPKVDDAGEPLSKRNQSLAGKGAVVLIDEIDKADPDLPNSLLVPLADRYFDVTDVGTETAVRQSPDVPPAIIVITTNQERELPRAFVRRCVVYKLPEHDKEKLRQIAHCHLGTDDHNELVAVLADRLEAARRSADDESLRPPSTAEFLDALEACLKLEISDPADWRWRQMEDMILLKSLRIAEVDESGAR
jgi:MoxR-like ATPase